MDNKYKVVCYIRVDSDDNDRLTIEEAISEKEQAELMQPENIYQIEEVDYAGWD